MNALDTESSSSAAAGPGATLETRDAIGIIVGMVIGAGVFTVPSLIAKYTPDPRLMLAAWLAGGILSLIGALCYAELATSYPSAGGDYFFVQRAYGRDVAFLYAWARVAVITTGSIAFLGFTFGDYMTKVAPLGAASSTLYAALAIVLLTLVNFAGIRQSKATQNLLTTLEVLGIVAIIVAGLWLVLPTEPLLEQLSHARAGTPSLDVTMVLVLFAYGGWNEAAYISAEMKHSRSIVTALIVSLAVVTALYLLVNLAYVRGLSVPKMAESKAVAADLLEQAFGKSGAVMMSLMVAISALTSANATVILGARSNFALGRDSPLFAWLGRWNSKKGTPTTALVVQCVVSLALVALGSVTRQGLQAMIDYTAPVFWSFFLLVGISVFILRAREPSRPRPFKVPLYPITPLMFCATCAYLLYSSLSYAKTGAIAGVGVIVFGFAPLALTHRRKGWALVFALSGAMVIALAFSGIRKLLLG